MLELNAGTGDDAVFFVQHGRHVHATDLAEGMIAAIDHKQKQLPADAHLGNLSFQQLSFTQLDQIHPAQRPAQGYDLVFSNFGGLNCHPDLSTITRHLPALLRRDGYVVWVIMPPICPWELAQAARGQFKTAFRRLHAGHSTLAHVEGAYFHTHYFSPKQVMQALGPQFSLRQLQSIGLFSPPSFLEAFPRRLPRLFHWLCRQDENAGRSWPFNRMGDYVMLTAQYTHV